MTYNSESGGSDKSSDNATDNDEEVWKSGCRELIIIDNLNNIKSNIKEHKLSSNNCNVLKSKYKAKPKFCKKNFKKKSREFNLIEKKASQEKAKYLKYKSLNKASSKKKTPFII